MSCRLKTDHMVRRDSLRSSDCVIISSLLHPNKKKTAQLSRHAVHVFSKKSVGEFGFQEVNHIHFHRIHLAQLGKVIGNPVAEVNQVQGALEVAVAL